MLRIFAPQIPLYGIGIVLSGLLQGYRRFAWPVLAPAELDEEMPVPNATPRTEPPTPRPVETLEAEAAPRPTVITPDEEVAVPTATPPAKVEAVKPRNATDAIRMRFM